VGGKVLSRWREAGSFIEGKKKGKASRPRERGEEKRGGAQTSRKEKTAFLPGRVK